jgi:hypothetical protein
MSKNAKANSGDPEAEFLAEQSRLAKQAIGQVIGEIEHNLARSADVRAWAARYPWPTVAAATAAGFGAGIATSAVIHSKNGHSNGADSEERLQAEAGKVPSAAEPENRSAKRSGGIGGGLRWLAGGLAAAAGEALFAATRKQLESALSRRDSGSEPTNERRKG